MRIPPDAIEPNVRHRYTLKHEAIIGHECNSAGKFKQSLQDNFQKQAIKIVRGLLKQESQFMSQSSSSVPGDRFSQCREQESPPAL